MCEKKVFNSSFNNDIYDNVISNSKTLLDLQRYLELDSTWSASADIKDVEEQIKVLIKDSGYYVEIENMVFTHMNKRQQSNKNNGVLSYLKNAEELWKKCIMNSICKMCSELGLPLSKKRTVDQQLDLEATIYSIMSSHEDYNKAYIKLKPVYSATDFFQMLISLKNNNMRESAIPPLGLMKTCLYVKDILELKSFYSILCTSPQMGLKCQFQKEDCFENEWIKVGNKVITRRSSSAARQYLKQGCPIGLRKQIWMVLLNLNLHDEDKLYYFQLKKSVLEYEMLVDHLLRQDILLSTTNSDLFFVFEDLLYQILIAFSRDTSLLNILNESSITPQKYFLKDSKREDNFIIYPPCGILPFHGFSVLAAPLCYIYEKPEELYFVFRELYVRYFIKLHSVSSDSQGILSICSLFELLLISEDITLFKYLTDIGAPPLKLVFNWLMFAYSGYLATEETLQLWDRIFGFNSLEVLAVLAVTIMEFRRENLLSATNLETAEAVLEDISTIKVVPLLTRFVNGGELSEYSCKNNSK